MKALIYKEFKLAMHPVCYVFIALFPLMILIPKYPIAVGFIYIFTTYPILFLGANKGQQSNDLLYSTLLPVRKKDIVLARILTVIIMQVSFILLMTAFYPGAIAINNAIIRSVEEAKQAGKAVEDMTIPGLGLNSYVLMLAIAISGYAVADFVYFTIYYKKGKSILLPTLLAILGFATYICLVTIGLPYIPGLEFLNSIHIGIQFAVLGVALLFSFGMHFITYLVASKRFEKVDF